MKRIGTAVAAIALTLGLGACGMTASSNSPGFADITVPRDSGLHRDTSISLGPALLKFVARHANEGPQTRALLESLDGVRVRVYSLDDSSDQQRLRRGLGDSVSQLLDDDWRAIVRVSEEESLVHVLVREDGERVLGLALLSVDQEELVLVNVMGRIDPDMLEELSRTLDTQLLALQSPGP